MVSPGNVTRGGLKSGYIFTGCAFCTVEFISIQSSTAQGEDEPGMMEGTAEVPHPIADAHLPDVASVLTLQQRLTLLWRWSIRSRHCWSSWYAMGCSRVSACRKSR